MYSHIGNNVREYIISKWGKKSMKMSIYRWGRGKRECRDWSQPQGKRAVPKRLSEQLRGQVDDQKAVPSLSIYNLHSHSERGASNSRGERHAHVHSVRGLGEGKWSFGARSWLVRRPAKRPPQKVEPIFSLSLYTFSLFWVCWGFSFFLPFFYFLPSLPVGGGYI
jgi:hypothetical protein